MKTNLKSLIAAACLALSTAMAATTAQAGPSYDGVYDCHVVMQLPNPNTTFDLYLVFMSKPNGAAGWAGLTIPNTGVFEGYSIGQLSGDVFTISGNSTNLTFNAPPNGGPITVSGTWAVLSTPVTSFTCTQVF